MRVSRSNKTLQRMHRDYSRIFRIRKDFLRKKLKQISKFLFFKKITLARWQLNTFSVMMLSLGFILGTYAMVTELVPRLMALDETTYTVEQAGDSELTLGSGTGVDISATEVKLGIDDNWFNLGWNFKKQLTVKNLSAVTLSTNTPIQLTLNTKELYDATKLQNDCDDLRIVHYTGSGAHTELTRSFYKANGSTNCSDSTATVVTFPIQEEMIAGASSGNYYLYYNNSGASNPGFGDDGYNIGSAEATLICPFNGTTTCVDGETPSTATGAIRYAGGSAISFDGVNDTVIGPSIQSLVGTPNASAFTVEGWFNFESIPSSPDTYLFATDNYNNTFGIGFTWAQIRLRADSTVLECSTPSLNTWTHIAASYDGTTLRLYKNGTLCNSAVITVVNTTAENFLIGQASFPNGNYPMKVDDVRVSNVARYTSNFTPQTTQFETDVSTKLLYHFDENGDDPRNTGKAIDASGNGNHGTITGTKYVSGVSGIDSVVSNIKGQSYAGHEGVFVEEGTTNLITNPSFEHGTYSTNWGLNYFNYNNTLDTFTAKMAKRNSAGPFAAGAIVQGDKERVLVPDVINYSGSTINGGFSTVHDSQQGSIVFWITPEWNGNDGKAYSILDGGYATQGIWKGSNGRLYFGRTNGHFSGEYNLTGMEWVSTDISSWVAGSTYQVVARWDADNTIDGTNYSGISVNDVHTYSFSSPLTIGNTSSLNIGKHYSANVPLNSIIEGFTVYRRPLFDGSYGIDVGNGDEINQIYNSGTGRDPTLVTGSWDVVFALPTNATVGEMTTGTGNAWSHPHSSNLLYTNTTNTGGFMMNGTYTSDGWANEGTPSSVAALSTSEKIFSGGYKTTSDAADEGIYYEKTVAAGNDWVIRALGHSDGTCVPKVILYNQTGGAEIGSITGTTTSTRTAPNLFVFSGEAPAGMTTLRVKLINTSSSGICYWHQVELYTNLITNASFETGSGDPYVPTGWISGVASGQSLQETTTVHSGASSFKLIVNAGSGAPSIRQAPSSITEDAYYNLGVWVNKVSGSNGGITGGNNNFRAQWLTPTASNQFGNSSGTIGSWQLVKGVAVRDDDMINSQHDGIYVSQSTYSSAHEGYYDDFYSFKLNDVSLTVTSASEVNSAETTGLRVDGRDTLTQTVTGLSVDRGLIKFKYTPRHSYSTAGSFGNTNPYIITIYGDNNNRIYLYRPSGSALGLVRWVPGDADEYQWASPTLNAGTTYIFEIAYSVGGNITLNIDGTQVASGSFGSTAFGTVPTTAYFGSDNSGTNQYDGTITNFIASTPTENTTSPFYKFGSKSAKLVNAGTIPDDYTTAIDPNSTASHTLSVYVYDGTTGNIGGTVSATVAKLVFGGSVVTPASYTDMGGGWWRLSYSAATIDASLLYGVQALAGKTIYVDGVQLEAKAYATTYGDGNLGTGYSWSGTEHESTSTRVASNLIYTNNSDLSANNGSVSFWTRPNSWSYGGLISRTYVSFGNFTLHYQQGTAPGNNNYWGLRINNNSPWATKALDFTNDKWVHIVATWNNGTSKVYVNGVGGTAQTYTGATVGNITFSSSPDSLISDFKVLNSAISDSEATHIYSQGLANHTNSAEDDNKYKTAGDYETDVLDLGNAGQWGSSPNLLTTEILNGNTIGYQTRSSEDGLVWSDYASVTGTAPNFSITSPAERYLQLKASLASAGQSTTPSLSGIQVNYVQDADPPDVNATVTVMKRTVTGDTITEDTYSNSQAPYFSWNEGADLAGGSGLRGYCLYLGADILGNPENDKGILGSSPGSTANTTCPFVVTTPNIDFANTNLRGNTWLQSSTDPYYFIIRAVDNTGNVFQGAPEVFSFYFDNTPPTNPSGLFAPASYQRSFDSFIISWPADGANAAQDAHSEVKGYQYKLGSSGIWYGGSHTGLQDCNDLLTTTTYTLDEDHDTLPSGETPFYFRTVDNACNTSSSTISAILKYNSTAPSAPQDLEVTPTTNDQNEFSFSWEPPSIFSGSIDNLSYCYTVNTLPSSGTCIFTSSTSLNPDAFATQPGENTFYVVSRDEASNINYGDYASIKFYANTSAPGVPRNLDVADISVKTTKNWRLTVSWDEPEDLGAGVAKYFVYRSFAENANCCENFSLFAKVGETAGGSYVDTNLQQKDHFYCVRACDSTNNCSAVSSTGSNFPDGKFTSPAILESAPVVSSVSTRSARISWITDRDSDSRISYGLASNDYFKEEVGNSEQRIDHDLILTNLEPGTTYYFQAKWTDEDGNLGLSDEYTFTTAPPPSVKDVVVSSVGISTAVINFTTTGSSRVNFLYGTSVGFGSSKEIATSHLESRYTTLLDGLAEGSKYYFRVDTEDDEGYVYEGTVLDFTTLPQPKLSNVRIQQVKNAAQPTVLVSWESNTEVTSVVSLFPEGNIELIREEVNLDLMSGEHQMIIRGLLPNTVYELMVKGSDKLGNQATSTAQRITTATDTRPPAISNVQIEAGKGNVTDSSQFIVTWTTDEPTTSQVEYGEGTGSSYPQRSQLDSNLTLEHTIVISGLAPGKVYHLRAVSTDDAENTTYSLDYVAITPKESNSAIELVISSLSRVFSFLR